MSKRQHIYHVVLRKINNKRQTFSYTLSAYVSLFASQGENRLSFITRNNNPSAALQSVGRGFSKAYQQLSHSSSAVL